MDKLLEALADRGLDASKLDEDTVRGVAKSMGLDPGDYLPRQVKVEPYTNKAGETYMAVKTESFKVGVRKNGKPHMAQGLFCRASILDDVIADLLVAKGILDATEE